MRKIFIFMMVVFSLFLSAPVAADYLTADPQPSDAVTKYRIDLNGEILSAEIETISDNQVRLYYNIDHLPDGKYNAFASAGNNNGEWSEWSNSLEFYRGIPTPQNIGLYCGIEEPSKISQQGWKVTHVSSEENENGKFGVLAIDGDATTLWHSGWETTNPDTKYPHEIQIDLGRTFQISGFYYLPRQDDLWNGTIKGYAFYVSVDGTDWTEVSSGELIKTKDEQLIEFPAQNAKYIRLVALSEVNGKAFTTMAELNILGI